MNKTFITRRQWIQQGSCTLLVGSLGATSFVAHAEEPFSEGAGRTVTLDQLHALLGPHFPYKYPVPGFLDFSAEVPRLSLLPQANRMAANMVVKAAGPALHRTQTGHLDMSFALRYEPKDRSLRAHQLRVNQLQFPGLKPEAGALIQAYGPALAESALQDVVLHQLSAEDLRLPTALGLQPGALTVTENGLRIAFEPKPL